MEERKRILSVQENILANSMWNNAVQIQIGQGKSEHYFLSQDFVDYVAKLHKQYTQEVIGTLYPSLQNKGLKY